MNYNDAINELTSQGKFYINLGLDRISKALDIFDNPQNDLKTIHIAGTNGKGSTCAILASILQEAGFKVGLYTSPHIFDYTERIQINGCEIPKNVFAQKVMELCKLPIHLTEFEILTTIAFCYFKEENVDYAIVEVGLGGRYDATNVIKHPLCSVITNINLDHTERLGNTISQIAFEKAGIIKNETPCVINSNNKGLSIVKEKCEPILVESVENENLSLKGIYQYENLALALKACEIAVGKLPQSLINNALKKVKHPCRFEYIKDKNLIIDGSHNPDGARSLRESLDKYFPNSKRRFVFGCLSNKDYENMMKNLFRPQDEIFFNHFDYPNSATFNQLQAKCPYKALPFKDLNLSNDVLTIICGSFYQIKSFKDSV